jgi:hypothetical protein
MTLDRTNQENDMESRTPEEVEESFNTIAIDTPVTDVPIETGWMLISAELPNDHKFVKAPVGDQYDFIHRDGTSLQLRGPGTVRFKLKAGVRVLVHSGWGEVPSAGPTLNYRYFDANDQVIDQFDQAATAPGYVFNRKSPDKPDIWGVEVSFAYGSENNAQYGMDNFFSLEPTSTRFKDIVATTKSGTSR